MLSARFRPLQTWTGIRTPDDERRVRPFKAHFEDTMSLLQRELVHLDARDVVIEADFSESDIRLDGWPRANARQPTDPAVRVAFESKWGPLIYASDSCRRWQDNLRSIALGLEALRAVDRYGVSRRGEQYTGWKALGAAPAAPRPPETSEQAWKVVYDIAGVPPGIRTMANSDVVRRAHRKAHPDSGGTPEQFHLLSAALKVLGLR